MSGLRLGFLCAVLAFLPACSCGGNPGESQDAGVDAGDAGFQGPTEPEAAALPTLTPCPDGWREVEDPGVPEVVVCEPWPEGGPMDCGSDEAHFPGEEGCVRIGTPCPAGDFPEGLPAGDVFYVLAGAVAGGNGTEGLPFAFIQDAIDAASDGDVVAIGKGVYDEAISVRDAITIVGACVAETIIARSVPLDLDFTVTLGAGGGGASLQNLTIAGERGGIDVLVSGEPVTIEGVVVRDLTLLGIVVGSGTVVARDLVVRDIRERPQFGGFGYGLDIETGGRLELARGAIERTVGAGVAVAYNGATIVASDVVVRDTRPQEDGYFGLGMDVFESGRAELTRVVFESNRTIGLSVRHETTALVAEDVVVRGTTYQERNEDYGGGMQIIFGASATVSRALLDGNQWYGLAVADPATNVVLSDLVVRDGESQTSDGNYGGGIQVGGASRAEVTRAAVLRNRYGGIVVGQAASTFVGRDLLVADQRGRAVDDNLGIGFTVLGGASADLARVVLERNQHTGLVVGEPATTLVASDVVIRDVQGVPGQCNVGFGILPLLGSESTFTRISIERARVAAVSAYESGTRITFEDLAIEETLDWGDVDPECEGEITGTGLLALRGSYIEATRFSVSDNSFCGVQLAEGGEIDLHTGIVSGNVVGANVQTIGFDVERLRDGVVYQENDRALDTTALPVPESVQTFQ